MAGVSFPTIPSRDLATHILNRSAQERFPLYGQWELTYRCNLRCVMCYTDCRNTPENLRGELSTDEIFRILDELQAAGCLELTLTGGEPLSRPDFLVIYRRAHSLGLSLIVFTNATMISPEVLDAWSTARPLRVEISLHSLSPSVFDAVTQVPGSFDRCLQTIDEGIRRRIPIRLKTVSTTVNRADVLAVKRYARERGVEFRLGEYLRDDLQGSGAPFDYQLDEAALHSLELQDPELLADKEQFRRKEASAADQCGGGGWNKFHIDSYGRLQRCSNNRHEHYDLRHGNFAEGFYQAMTTFPCPNRQRADLPSPSFQPLPVMAIR